MSKRGKLRLYDGNGHSSSLSCSYEEKDGVRVVVPPPDTSACYAYDGEHARRIRQDKGSYTLEGGYKALAFMDGGVLTGIFAPEGFIPFDGKAPHPAPASARADTPQKQTPCASLTDIPWYMALCAGMHPQSRVCPTLSNMPGAVFSSPDIFTVRLESPKVSLRAARLDRFNSLLGMSAILVRTGEGDMYFARLDTE